MHKRHTDADGIPRWRSVRELHEDGWVEYWQRPADLRDGRESIRIGAWPEKLEKDELKDAQANRRRTRRRAPLTVRVRGAT